MRKLKFDVTPNTPPELVHPHTEGKNGLFETLFRGYSSHYPVVISPDDVSNTIVCIWSKYITLNAEEFREEFVKHEGKKEITYESGGTYSDGRHQEFFDGLTQLIREDQDSENTQWFDVEFSTTTNEDRLIRSAALLSSQKKYYEFTVMLMCGFSEVTLLGSIEDWVKLKEQVESMPVFDEGMRNWKTELTEVVEKFATTIEDAPDVDWWQSVITGQSCGSGPRYVIAGWAKVFNPFNEEGTWLQEKMTLDQFLDMTVDFEINVNDNGHEFKLNINAGVTGVDTNEGGSISPNKYFQYNITK